MSKVVSARVRFIRRFVDRPKNLVGQRDIRAGCGADRNPLTDGVGRSRPRINRNYTAALRFASITVNAVMFTIRRTVALDVRMFTGPLTPSRNGPTATLLPASVLSRL